LLRLFSGWTTTWKVSKKNENQAKGVLGLIHTDLCGPLLVASLSSSRYLMALTYDYSCFTWVYFMKRKYEDLLTFKVFKQMIKNFIEKIIKYLRTNDGGGIHVTFFYHLPSWVRHSKAIDSVMDSSIKWGIKKEK